MSSHIDLPNVLQSFPAVFPLTNLTSQTSALGEGPGRSRFLSSDISLSLVGWYGLAMITFTALSGVQEDGSASSYLLQIDDHVRILLSAGWNDSFDPHTLPPALHKVARTLDLVLLSHPTIDHVGALPFIVRHLNPTVAVYATLPVKILGRLACLEVVKSKREESGYGAKQAERELQFQPGLENGTSGEAANGTDATRSKAHIESQCTEDDIEAVFNAIHVVRYSQPTALTGKMGGIVITAFNAGHTLGGTIWKVERDGESVVYANGINHMRERHLDGTELLRSDALRRPDILIADGGNALVDLPKRKARDAAFVGLITANVLGDNENKPGSVLVPVDAAARVLEHALLLDQHWSFTRMSTKAHLVLLSHTSDLLVQEVRSMTEWMGRDISATTLPGTDGSANFGLKHFKLCKSIAELESIAQNDIKSGTGIKPMVILTPSDSLTNGYGRSLFAEMALIPETLVVLPGRGQTDSFTRQLWTLWNERGGPQLGSRGSGKGARDDVGGPVILNDTRTLRMSRSVMLEGEELEVFERHREQIKEQREIQDSLIRHGRALLEQEDSDDSESDEEGDYPPNGLSATGKRQRLSDRALEIDGSKDLSLSMKANLTNGSPYDILMTGFDRSASQSQRFFKQSSSIGARHLVFPDSASLTRGYLAGKVGSANGRRMKGRKADVYGEWPDLERWERAARGAADLEASHRAEDAALPDENQDMKIDELETSEQKATESELEIEPLKYLVENRDIEIKCRLFCVNLEGLNDGKAIKTLLPQVNPRKLVIIHASEESTNHLLETFKAIPAMTTKIYAPVVNEMLLVGEETHSWQIQLGESMVRSLKFSKFLDYDLAAVNGFIHFHGEQNAEVDGDRSLEESSESTTKAPKGMPFLELTAVRPSAHEGASKDEDSEMAMDLDVKAKTKTKTKTKTDKIPLPRAHLPSSLFIGDIKLTELRTHMRASGISSEFVGGGVLLCGKAKAGSKMTQDSGVVAIRKRGRGRIVLEGNVSEKLYQIRQIIYAQAAQVTI